MKKLIPLFALLAITLFGCNKQLEKTSAPGERVAFVKNADLSKELTAKELAVVKENNVKVKEQLLAAKKKNNNTIAAAGTPIAVALVNNGDGSYTWVYATLAPGDLIIYNFFRWGTALSTTSGNVIPENSASYYYPNTSTTTFVQSFYGINIDAPLWKQVVTITGDFSLDANGTVGTGWAVSYSNPVQ